MPDAANGSSSSPMSKQDRLRWGAVVLALAAGLIAFIVWGRNQPKPVADWIGQQQRAARSAPATREAPPAHSPIDGLTACRSEVKARLKSPGTAKFRHWLDSPLSEVTSLGGGRYRVESWVDSENSFGALMRAQFVCEVKFPEGTGTVRFL